tara:strand:- start:78 stop:563 length:486 start_codon:yes stop_codon:yes gene_type:complete
LTSNKRGYRKPRVIRPVEENVPPSYDSNWEYELHTGLLKKWEHHVEKVNYVIKHKYEPDFVKIVNNKTILLEAKGRFWDFAEYSKYIWVKKVLPSNIELVFLFANPSAPMPQAKRRKDGTKRSHGEWASANGFRWYSEDSLPDEWVDTKHKKDNTLNIESD